MSMQFIRDFFHPLLFSIRRLSSQPYPPTPTRNREEPTYLGHSNLHSTLIYLHVTEMSESKGREVQTRLLHQVLAG